MEQKPLEVLTEMQAREREIEIAAIRYKILTGADDLMPEYEKLISYTVVADNPQIPRDYQAN